MTDRLVALTIRQVSLSESRAYGHRGAVQGGKSHTPTKASLFCQTRTCVSISPKSHGEHYEVKVASMGVQSPT